MKKKIIKLLNPSNKIVISGMFIIILSLSYLILLDKFNTPISYVLYLVMTYSLIIIVIKLVNIIKYYINKIINNNKYLLKYKKDYKLRYKVSLYTSLSFNILYVIFKFTSGIIYNSIWFIVFSLYYLLLVIVRTNILKEELKDDKTIRSEWLKYRKCGVILLFMNVILTMIILVILNLDISNRYHLYITIFMAMYTFYIMIYSIVNLIKYRKLNSPLIMASKVVNIITSLIGMLSLEVTMLSTFGENKIVFNKIMIISTGGGISIIIFIICMYMIIKSTEWLNNN